MTGLRETARIYPRIGRENGAPVFSETYTEAKCRALEGEVRSIRSSTFFRDDEARRSGAYTVYMDSSAEVSVGDRIVCGERALIVTEIFRAKGLYREHHLKLICKGEY